MINDFVNGNEIGFSKYIFYRDGSVFSKIKNEFLLGSINSHNGYRYVHLSSDSEKSKGYRIHILICRAFNGEKPKHNSIVGHYNNIKTDNRAENLYWTTNKENTRKSWEDGCSVSIFGDENKDSVKIKVLDAKTHEIIGVYGSLRECERCVENTDLSHISKVYKRGIYKTRSKKYIYTKCTDEEYCENLDKKMVLLVENPKVDKSPTLFKVTFLETGNSFIFDNQTSFSKKYGIKQTMVSNFIKNNSVYKDMKFELIEKIDIKESSSYQNFINTCEEIVVENIFTKKKIKFKTVLELKNYFDIKGNDVRGCYVNKNYLIHSEWKVI